MFALGSRTPNWWSLLRNPGIRGLPYISTRASWSYDTGSAAYVAFPSRAQVPKLGGIPLLVFWYCKPFFSAGVQSISIEGGGAKIYSPENYIADCFQIPKQNRFRCAVRALRTYRERTRKPNLKLISRFAGVDRLENVIRS